MKLVRICSVVFLLLFIAAMVVIIVTKFSTPETIVVVSGPIRTEHEVISHLPPSFSGSSNKLNQTQVVPTLDTPIQENHNAIWCASMQLAWNSLKNDIVNEPIRLSKNQEIVDRLNNAPQTSKDMNPTEYLAMSGFMKDGILEKIRKALDAQFPGNTVPPITVPGDSIIVSFGYLKAAVMNKYAYYDNNEKFTFTSGDGKRSAVRSFGIPESKKEDSQEHTNLCRDQLRVLHRDEDGFSVDVSEKSEPNQVILAKFPRRKSLQDAIEYLKTRKAPRFHELLKGQTLLIPNQYWRLDKEFTEIQGPDSLLLNRGFEGQYISKVFQCIDFQMDRFGTKVESNAWMTTGAGSLPNEFHFDQPYLILMKKRGADHPFFAMWVDNAELLVE